MAYKVKNEIVIPDVTGPHFTELYQFTNSYIESAHGFYDSSSHNYVSMDNAQDALDWLFGNRLVAGTAIKIIDNEIHGDYKAGTAIDIIGDVINIFYRTGDGIKINGDVIHSDYVAGVGIKLVGNKISMNYTAGDGIDINGSIISGDYVAGDGIIISNNTILLDPAMFGCCNG